MPKQGPSTAVPLPPRCSGHYVPLLLGAGLTHPGGLPPVRAFAPHRLPGACAFSVYPHYLHWFGGMEQG